MKSSFWGRARIPVLILLLVLVLAGGFYLYERLRGRVDLEIKIPAEPVELGKPFDLEVSLTNNSANTLRNVRLEMELSENLIRADKPSEKVVSRLIGDMVNGRIQREAFKVLAIPGETGYKIRLTAHYVPASISANLQKTEETEVEVRKPDFRLEVNAPDRVFSGEEFEIRTSYRKEDNLETPDLELKLNYPPDFTVITVTPEPQGDNRNWRLRDVGEGEGMVSVKGKVQLPDEANFSIGAELVMRILGKQYPVSRAIKNIAINPSPLAFRVALGTAAEVVQPGEELSYFLQYRNNAEVPLQEVVIRAQLVGEMFDFSSLETNASVNRLTNTLIWNPSQVEELKSLEPGEEGQVSFVIKVKDNYPINKLNDKNFVLKVAAQIESPIVPYLIAADKTVNSSVLETKVAGRLTGEAKAYFRDVVAKIVNSGPLPPKVGIPTNFTIHWSLTNWATDVKEVEVRAKLEEGVSFTGKVKGNISSLPQFEPATREVIWHLGDLPATTGVLGEKPEVVFQVEAIPASSQAGQYMPLLGETQIKALDSFTGLEIRSSTPPLTTRLPDDPTVVEGKGLVER